MTIKMDEILSRQVSYLSKVNQRDVIATTLRDILSMNYRNEALQHNTNWARNYVSYADGKKQALKEYKDIKMAMPAFANATFANGVRRDSDATANGLIILDIDDVEDAEQLKKCLFELPYVAYCQTSISGYGVWALVPYDTTHVFDSVYSALESEVNRQLQFFAQREYNRVKHVYKVDEQCNNIGRLRIMSHDDLPLCKDECEVFTDYNDGVVDDLFQRAVQMSYVPKMQSFAGYKWVRDGSCIPHLNHTERIGLYATLNAMVENDDAGFADVNSEWQSCMYAMEGGKHTLEYYLSEPYTHHFDDFCFVDKEIRDRCGYRYQTNSL